MATLEQLIEQALSLNVEIELKCYSVLQFIKCDDIEVFLINGDFEGSEKTLKGFFNEVIARYNHGEMPSKKALYIQHKYDGELETVDEVDVIPRGFRDLRHYAERICKQWQSSDRYGYYYISSRPCKAWKERG